MDHATSQDAVRHFTQEYERAREQFSELPTIEVLDKNTDILEVISRNRHFPRNVIRYTRWHLMQVVNGWAGYLHEFILPNQQSAVSLEEYNYFDDREKEGIIQLLNWIMYRSRESHRLQLDENDEATAAFIVSVWGEWIDKKPLLKKVIDKNIEVWQKKVEG